MLTPAVVHALVAAGATAAMLAAAFEADFNERTDSQGVEKPTGTGERVAGGDHGVANDRTRSPSLSQDFSPCWLPTGQEDSGRDYQTCRRSRAVPCELRRPLCFAPAGPPHPSRLAGNLAQMGSH